MPILRAADCWVSSVDGAPVSTPLRARSIAADSIFLIAGGRRWRYLLMRTKALNVQPESDQAGRSRKSAGLVLFDYGFRPLFFAALVHAAFVIPAWLAIRALGVLPLSLMPAQLWHGHEMLFGFVGAAIGGFLLTAVPGWTGTRAVSGPPLIAVTMAWLAGRIAFAFASVVAPAIVVVAELLFLFALILLVAPPLLRARNRNTPILIVLAAFWLMDAGFLYALHRQDVVLASRILLIALDVVLLLITVIGGRIVPSFTANALRKSGVDAAFVNARWIEIGVIVAMVFVIVADAFPHLQVAVGPIAALAAIAHAIRLARWHTLRTFSEPIVWVLHLAYAWLPIGLALKAVHLATGAAWAANWLHALGMGVVGTMIVAVITRASLGHTGRPLAVASSVALAYGLLSAAAFVRVFGPVLSAAHREWTILAAGMLWAVAFALIVRVYAPILMRPRVDGQPG